MINVIELLFKRSPSIELVTGMPHQGWFAVDIPLENISTFLACNRNCSGPSRLVQIGGRAFVRKVTRIYPTEDQLVSCVIFWRDRNTQGLVATDFLNYNLGRNLTEDNADQDKEN